MVLFMNDNCKIFHKLLDKATSPNLFELDWEIIIQICDLVKGLQVTPKYAVQSIKKKLHHENPYVVIYSLQCLESMVKNCGGSIHKEIAQKSFIEALKQLIKYGSKQIRDKVLELIQCWSYGLGEEYEIFQDTYQLLKNENYHFPLLNEKNQVMFINDDIAPEWRYSKQCFSCQLIFNKYTHKHHCRACGQTFCNKCSSQSCPIPKFGIHRDVRVCDACYEKLTMKVPITSKSVVNQENDEKERQTKLLTHKYTMTTAIPIPTTDTSENIEQEQQQTDIFMNQNEIDEFSILLNDHIDHFKLRILSDQQRYRNITSDTAVQSIFFQLENFYPALFHYMKLIEDQRIYYENLQDKLTQLIDARDALNALRIEYNEKKQQQAFEHERQRQIQLAEKLDLMRQKKQDYLEYQRQLTCTYPQSSYLVVQPVSYAKDNNNKTINLAEPMSLMNSTVLHNQSKRVNNIESRTITLD